MKTYVALTSERNELYIKIYDLTIVEGHCRKHSIACTALVTAISLLAIQFEQIENEITARFPDFGNY